VPLKIKMAQKRLSKNWDAGRAAADQLIYLDDKRDEEEKL